MGSATRAVFLLAALLTAPAALAGAERRLEGRVLETVVTLCQLKPRGCAGYMTVRLENEKPGRDVMVQVRLGVPIRRGDKYVLLATLTGHSVSVVYVLEKGSLVARTVKVAEPADPAM